MIHVIKAIELGKYLVFFCWLAGWLKLIQTMESNQQKIEAS